MDRLIVQPPPPPLTQERIVTWLRTQDPDREYVWQDPVHCLVGNYLRDHGSQWGSVAYSELPDYELIAKEKPWTFGAALARAERLLATEEKLALPVPEILTPDIAPSERELLALPALAERAG